MKFASVVGTRPQFVKAGPLSRALRARHQEILIHTGQHYDREMSAIFFEDLGVPQPDYHLGIGSALHGAQTAAMLSAVEGVLVKETPDAVIVYGDTNSTLAGALAAAKLGIPVAHVEAGLRSFNRAMPEEINRVLTDHLSAWLFAPSELARQQLAREGITAGVHVVGDIMADALRLYGARSTSCANLMQRLRLGKRGYYLATVHRAENSDNQERLRNIVAAFRALELPVVLPLHPRTRKRLAEFGIAIGGRVTILDPLGYPDMLTLEKNALCILTDSGGIQKEAYYLRVPCVTLRDETEWVETLSTGWNELAGTSPQTIVEAARRARDRGLPHPDLYGDGRAAQRIVDILSGGRSSGPTAPAPERRCSEAMPAKVEQRRLR